MLQKHIEIKNRKKSKNTERSEDEHYVESMVFRWPEKERQKSKEIQKKMKSLKV